MQYFILVDELKYQSGVYGFCSNNLNEISTNHSVLDKIIAAHSYTMTQELLDLLEPKSREGSLWEKSKAFASSMIPGYELGKMFKRAYDAYKNIENEPKSKWKVQKILPPDDQVIVVIPESISLYYNEAYNRPEFFGTFKHAGQLQKVLEADGKNSIISVMPIEKAKESFIPIGGGIFKQGPYLRHPKKKNALVPFESYHSILLKEHDEEFIRLLACLGARTIHIETIEGVAFDGSTVIPARGKLDFKYKRNEKCVKSYDFYPQTADFVMSLKDAVWIQDYPKMLTFLETRKSHRLKSFSEVVDINTSFGVDLDIVLSFDSAFKWVKNSKYKFDVQFYSRDELNVT